MKNNDWILRIKGNHAITIFANGEVRYSVGKRKLFTLKRDVVKKLESMIKLSVSQLEDSVPSNLIRFNSGKGVITIKNCKLYTDIWKFIYDADSIADVPEQVIDLVELFDYIIHYGDPVSEVPLQHLVDPEHFKKLLGIDEINDSLVNLILTKNNKIYYA